MIDMTDEQLYRLVDLKDVSPIEAMAARDELDIREAQRSYSQAYVLRMYFSPGESSLWKAVKDLARRTEHNFTFYNTFGTWEHDIETSCVAEFIFNPTTDPYVERVQDLIKLSDLMCRQYKQQAVVLTYQGSEPMRQWLIESKEEGE
jgi:hypothetical protein